MSHPDCEEHEKQAFNLILKVREMKDKGYSNAEIARQLNIPEHSVRTISGSTG